MDKYLVSVSFLMSGYLHYLRIFFIFSWVFINLDRITIRSVCSFLNLWFSYKKICFWNFFSFFFLFSNKMLMICLNLVHHEFSILLVDVFRNMFYNSRFTSKMHVKILKAINSSIYLLMWKIRSLMYFQTRYKLFKCSLFLVLFCFRK